MAAKPVVAGTDGSEESLRAVEWAAREAALRRSPLRVVTVPVYPQGRVPGWALSGTLGRVARHAADRALDLALERAGEAGPRTGMDTAMLTGPPAAALAAEGRGAALLVVGSRGAGGFAALVLGSVSRYVATHAPCPVVVVREESAMLHGEIVAGVGDPAESSAALAFAFEEAALRGARLLLVHAVYALPLAVRALGALSVPEEAAIEHREAPADVARRLGDELKGWMSAYPQVPAGIDVADGHAGHVLAGESARADLVVLGRRRSRGRGAGAGSVLHAVLAHAHGPVATVPAVGGHVPRDRDPDGPRK